MALWRPPQWPARHGGLRVSLAKRQIPGSGNVPSESPVVHPLGIPCFAGDKASLSSEPVAPVSVTETQGLETDSRGRNARGCPGTSSSASGGLCAQALASEPGNACFPPQPVQHGSRVGTAPSKGGSGHVVTSSPAATWTRRDDGVSPSLASG